jgi:hypothetical protein
MFAQARERMTEDGRLQSVVRSARTGLCYPFIGCSSSSEYSQIPDFSDCWRPAQDEVSDVLGQQRPGDVRGDAFYELRRNLNDERVRLAFEAVLVTDSVIHVSMQRPTGGGTYVVFNQ